MQFCSKVIPPRLLYYLLLPQSAEGTIETSMTSFYPLNTLFIFFFYCLFSSVNRFVTLYTNLLSGAKSVVILLFTDTPSATPKNIKNHLTLVSFSSAA